MNYSDLKITILSNSRNIANKILKPARVKVWICPICGSGSGPKGTEITCTFDQNHPLFRFLDGNCLGNKGTDIFGVVSTIFNIQRFSEQLKKCADILGLPYEAYTVPTASKTLITNQRSAPIIKKTNSEELTKKMSVLFG